MNNCIIENYEIQLIYFKCITLLKDINWNSFLETVADEITNIPNLSTKKTRNSNLWQLLRGFNYSISYFKPIGSCKKTGYDISDLRHDCAL